MPSAMPSTRPGGQRAQGAGGVTTMVTPAESIAALKELRAARRRKRVAGIHWIDALYQVYLTAIFGGGAVIFISGVVGGDRLDPAGVDRVLAEGPALLGVIVAAAVALGLRSGARGGPIALEAPDVRHVLLSPVPRTAALRGPAVRQLRFAMFVAVVVGAIVGQLAVRRMGGSALAWVACGALFAAATVALGLGCALVASGRRIPSWVATVVGGGLLAWALGDVFGSSPASPTSYLGLLAFWPIDVDPLAVVPAVLAAVLLALGLLWVGGVSLEAAERRTHLVGQLKFAATLQDLRTVIVLRRQLAMELPRVKPWVRERSNGRFPIWHRGVRGILRWPLARVGRVVIVSVVAGLALRGVWEGTTPLVVVAGLAMFVAGLDAIEPLAQETDHPGRRDALPVTIGHVMVRHLPVAAVVMVLAGLVAAVTAVALDPSAEAARLAAICLLPAALAGGAAAVISVVMGAPAPSDNWQLLPPEVQGSRTLFRTVWPPLVATLGAVPVALARSAYDNGGNPYDVAFSAGFVVLLVVGLVSAWVHQREVIKAWWRSVQEVQGLAPAAQAAADADRGSGSNKGRSNAGSSVGRPAPKKPAPRKVKTRLERP